MQNKIQKLDDAYNRSITDKEYDQFQKLIYKEAGIHLSGEKKSLLVGRLSKRLRELNLDNFSAYYNKVVGDSSGAELVILLDAITTNETHFFREPHHFEYLQNHIFPEWKKAAEEGRRSRTIRIWSAASSTGEEPYSLAMAALEYFPPEKGWKVEISASDISTRVLELALAGVWHMDRSHSIPPALLKRYMLRGSGAQEGKMAAGHDVRSVLKFQRLNLNEAHYHIKGPFDAIFCRNVMIYFDQESRTRVVERLLNLLTPEGYFFLGHAESLSGVTTRVSSLAPAVYKMRPLTQHGG